MSSSKILILHGDTFQVELVRDKYIKNLRNKVNFERGIYLKRNISLFLSQILKGLKQELGLNLF